MLKNKKDTILIYGLLAAMLLTASALDRDFLSVKNLTNVVVTSLPFIIAAYGQTIAIISGGVDLSMGAMISFATTICATKMRLDAPWGFLPGIFFAIAAGILIGTANGSLAAVFHIQPLIATLSTSLIIGGLALFMLPKPGGRIHMGLAKTVSKNSAAFLILILVSVSLWLLLNRTKLGKAVYAVGGNENAAFSAGISIKKTKITAFAMVGLLASIAGIVMSCQMYSGDPTAGGPLTLRSITAAVIGGTSFSGGKGRIECTLAGALLFSIINNILNLAGVSTFYQYVAQGLLLIFAIAVTSGKKRNAG